MTALDGLTRTILLSRDYVSDHLTDEEICLNLQSVRVLCVSDLRNLSSYSGQTALVTLVSLLLRMGMQVGLCIPEVEMVGPQPPLAFGPLRAMLMTLSENVIAGAFVRRNLGFQPDIDIIFVLGDTKFDSQQMFWRLSGDDWAGSLKMGDTRTESHAWRSTWTAGSMISAALAANEAFKFAVRRLELRDPKSQIFFEASQTSSFDFGKISWSQGSIDLGCIDVISAGAISQSALYALLRFPVARISGRIFDDDITAPSNLNRNMLTLADDIGATKVQLIADVCAPRFLLQPIKARFPDADSGELASQVVIGVDDIPSRWAVQRLSSGWLAVGGTSHFSVSSSDHCSTKPCCGCLHPVDDVDGGIVPTISFVSFWAGLATAVRLLRKCIGQEYGRERQHLWLTPLRLDQPHAAMWLPVGPTPNCPVRCRASLAQLSPF